MCVESHKKIKNKQAELLHKILLRYVHILSSYKQKKGNGLLKIQDSSYLGREQQEKEFAIKRVIQETSKIV